MPKHDPENKECGMNQHSWRDERFCSCPSQSKQSQGGNKDTSLKPLPDTHPSRSPLPDTHPKGGERNRCSLCGKTSCKCADNAIRQKVVTPREERAREYAEENQQLLDDRKAGVIGLPPQARGEVDNNLTIEREAPVYYSNKRSACCNEPAVLSASHGYFCGGVDGCGKSCEAVPADNKDEVWREELEQYCDHTNCTEKCDLIIFVETLIAQAEKRGKIWATDAYMRGRSDERERIWEEAEKKIDASHGVSSEGDPDGKILRSWNGGLDRALSDLKAIINNGKA